MCEQLRDLTLIPGPSKPGTVGPSKSNASDKGLKTASTKPGFEPRTWRTKQTLSSQPGIPPTLVKPEKKEVTTSKQRIKLHRSYRFELVKNFLESSSHLYLSITSKPDTRVVPHPQCIPMHCQIKLRLTGLEPGAHPAHCAGDHLRKATVRILKIFDSGSSPHPDQSGLHLGLRIRRFGLSPGRTV